MNSHDPAHVMKDAMTKLVLKELSPRVWGFIYPNEDRVASRFLRGIEEMERESYKRAERSFRKVLSLCPDHLAARNFLAELFAETDRIEAALRLWQEVIDRGFKALPKDFEPGEDILSATWLHNEPFLEAIQSIVLIVMRVGRYEEAAEDFGELLLLEPADVQGNRIYLTECYFHLHDPESILVLAEAYPDDDYPDLPYGKALAALQLGRRDEAGDALKGAVEEFPRVAERLLSDDPVPKDAQNDDAVVTALEYYDTYQVFWKQTEGALDLMQEVLRETPGTGC